MSGWIKLHREIKDKAIFDNEKLLKTFIWCLLKATHTEHEQLIGRQKVPLKSGQFVTGRNKASVELNMSPSTTWEYLKILESNKSINIKSNNKFSIISIENWGLYQSEEEKADNKPNNKSDTKSTTNRQQIDTNKNDKNVKNDKEDIYSQIFEHWNSKEIIQHRKLTDKMKTKIKTTLKDYDVETIKEIISTYAEIIHDDKYYFTYKWSLEDFLQRGLKQFENSDVAKQNFLKKEFNNNSKQNPTNIKKTRFHMKEQRSDNYSNDELEGVMDRKRREASERNKKR